jgi:Na+/pantothenate symporter
MASEPSTSSSGLSGLEKFYVDNFVIAIIISVCCGIIGLVLNLVAFFTAKDPKAKNNAMICLIISAVLSALGIALNFMGVLGNLGR